MFDESYRNWKNWTVHNFGQCDDWSSAYFSAELTRIGLYDGMLRVLELGFGNGSFLRFSRDQGYAVVGIEVNRELCKAASDVGFDVHSDLSEVANGYFDLVCAFDVLEHIPQNELANLFAAVHAALRPGGIFLSRFPNGDSPFGRAFQHGDLTHVTTLGSGKIMALASIAKFEILFCQGAAIPLANLNIKRRIQRRVAVATRALIERFIGALYFRSPICLDLNLVAALRKPIS